MSDLIVALDGLATIEYASETFDEASGALSLEDVKINFVELPDLIMTAKRVELWGVDSDFLEARLNGERLNDRGMIAKRVEILTDLLHFLAPLRGIDRE